MTTAIANVGMGSMGINAPAMTGFVLAGLAKTVYSLAIPTISMYALSNFPVAAAKNASGGRGGDVFVQCVDACDRNGKDAHEAAKLLCYGICFAIDFFSKKK